MATYKCALSHRRFVLVHTVIVTGDGACSDVDSSSDDGVAQVSQMTCLGALAELYLLGFDEVPNMGLFTDIAAWANVGVGANDGSCCDLRTGDNRPLADEDT